MVVTSLPSAVVSGKGLLSPNMSSDDLKVDQVLILIRPSGVMEFLAVG